MEESEAQNLHYFAWKVGDGLCLSILMPDGTRVQIDCGSQQPCGNEIAFKRVREFQPQHLFISHFHKDHYQGLFSAEDKVLNIEALYSPKIPSFSDSKKFTLQLIAMNYRMLSGPKKFTELTIIDKVRKANRKNFLFIPLWRGKPLLINGQSIDILWPPKHLKDSEITQSIKKAMVSFEDALESDNELKAIYEKLQVQDHASSFSNDSQISCFPNNSISKEIPESTKSANKNMRGAANSLSLCLRIGKEMLFLGDLGAREIKIVVDKLNREKGKYGSLITPHHGTQWHESMGGLKVQFAVSSLGKKLKGKYKENKIGSALRLDTLVDDVVCPGFTTCVSQDTCLRRIQCDLES